MNIVNSTNELFEESSLIQLTRQFITKLEAFKQLTTEEQVKEIARRKLELKSETESELEQRQVQVQGGNE